jgi:hypothetical protein
VRDSAVGMKLSKEMEARVLELAGIVPEPPAKQPLPAPARKRKRREVALDAAPAWAVTLYPACRVVTEANTHEHWRTKARRFEAQRQAMEAVWQESPLTGPPIWKHVPGLVVTLTHVGPTMDDDNLAGAFKAVRDAVAECIGRDDGDPWFRWEYAQRAGEPGIEIRIEGLRS